MPSLAVVSAVAAALAVWLCWPPSALQRLSPAWAGKTFGWLRKRLLAWVRQIPTTAKQRRVETVKQELPLVCDLLAVCLETGLPLRVAVDALVDATGPPVRSALAQVSARVQLGVEETLAWEELRETPGWEELASELSFTAATGVSAATALRELGVRTRKSVDAAAQERARSVGVRSVLPLMLCFMPAFVLLGIVPIIGGVVAGLFG